MNVYLSGGMKTPWREAVKEDCPKFHYFDPCGHGLDDPVHYTAWDIEMIKQSDIVFAYLAESNPSETGLALEIGYAIGIGKTVIFANEKRDPRFYIVECLATIATTSLDRAIEILKRFEVAL